MARSVKELKHQELEQKCEQAKKIVERRPSINQDGLAISVGYPAWHGEGKRHRRTEKANKNVQALTYARKPWSHSQSEAVYRQVKAVGSNSPNSARFGRVD